MKIKMQKIVAKTLAWSLLFNAMLPIGLLAHEEKGCATCPTEKVVHANVVDTDKLHVKCNASVGGDLKVVEDVLIKGDLTVKGKIHGKFSCNDNVADYIVIGMGGSGAVIAKRLTDDKETSVIGLEAGDNNNEDPAIFIPQLGYSTLLPDFYPEYFWQGETKKEPQLADQSFQWTSGRLLGGSTSINGMIMVRGSNAYWSNIETLLGPDWSLKKTLKRYKKLETYISPFPASPARGHHGPWVNVALPETPTADASFLTTAMASVSNAPVILDYNDPLTPIGVYIRHDTDERPVGSTFLRESTAFAFLNEDVMTPDGIGVHGRKLRVHLRATAIDLLWNKNRVIGVRYTQNGQAFEIFARKEVIVSTGFQSAQFLQRNGIGPKNVLDAAGVPVRVDNPNVGLFYNHVNVELAFAAPDLQLTPANEPWALWGPGAFLPQVTPLSGNPELAARDIQWTAVQLSIVPNVVFVIGALLNPKSVGTVQIQNDDPLKIPVVHDNYLTNPHDLQELVNASKHFGLDLTDYLATHTAPNGSTWQLIIPDPSILTDPDTTALEDYLKSNLLQSHHFTAGCRAGMDATTAVVDPHGKVFGVEGLRVADDSILPYVPDGNTGTPAVLVGWTISDFIMAGK